MSPVCTQDTALIPFQPYLTRPWKPDGRGGGGQVQPHSFLPSKPDLVFLFLFPVLEENPTGWCRGQFSRDGNRSRHRFFCRRTRKDTHRSTVGKEGHRHYRNGGQTDCFKALTDVGRVMGHGSVEKQMGTGPGKARAEIHSPGRRGEGTGCPPKEC